MEGTIKIEAIPDKGLAVELKLRRISVMDKLAIVDALVEALEMDQRERKMLSLMFAMGGFGFLPGVDKQKIEVDQEAFELFKKTRGDGNETDAH